jgi:small subunit ribosomal protein S21
LQVFVRDNNVDQALRILKKKMQREGMLKELKQRRFYEKPSEKVVREKAQAVRRARKVARKQAERDGLISAAAKKKMELRKRPGGPGGPGRPGAGPRPPMPAARPLGS